MKSNPSARKIFHACLFWVTVLCLCSCAPVILKKEDIQLSAQKGDARSQVMIGEMYEFGVDFSADPSTAAKWYQLAAFQDNPEAQYYLGVMYEQGTGISRNSSEALRWLFKAGEQGQEKAQIFLAAMYLKDKSLQPEFTRRIKAYRQTAEKGNAAAQYTLAWIYREGAGQPVKPKEALMWYHKAAAQGNKKAQFALGSIYLEGKLAPANPGDALTWYQKSADTEIRARVKLYELYKGTGGIQENEQEAEKWSKTLPQNTDVAIRTYINTQYDIVHSEKENNPTRALRACRRISELDPAGRKTVNTCEALQKQMIEKMNPRIQEARSALEKKDWDRFRELLSRSLAPDFDNGQLRRLIAFAWRLNEEETRSREKTATELLASLEAAEKSAAYRKKNAHQIPRLISAFKTTINKGLNDYPGDAALIALAQRGKKVIASLYEKMKPPRPLKERPKDKMEEKDTTDFPEEIQEEAPEPGEDDYKKAQALFDNGRFVEASQLFEKTTKIRGSRYIASAYIYLGVSHLAQTNPSNINEARKLRLKGLACFQNALRFDRNITLPGGYDKYLPVFNEAKRQLH